MYRNKEEATSVVNRWKKDYSKETEAVKAAKDSGGSCSNCKLFTRPKHGTLGYCMSKEDYRNTYNICGNHQFI